MKIQNNVRVKSDGKVVALVDVPVFEPTPVDISSEEQQDLLTHLGEAYKYFRSLNMNPGVQLLSLVNTQYGTNVRNKAREPFNRKLTKAAARQQAVAELDALETEQLVAIHRDKATGGTQGWLDRRTNEILKNFEEVRKAQIAKAASGIDQNAGQDPDDEDDE